MQAKKSLLVHGFSSWVKRNHSECDTTMGSYDGAETCELVGLFLLFLLKHIPINLGLYKDDGLGVCSLLPRQIERYKKEICSIFKSQNLSITIEANLKIVDFLDVTFDLDSGIYKPFMKPNDTPLYVHKLSNHPPSITKNIPIAINRRLSSISSNQKVFNDAIPPYQKALKESGYDYVLKFEPPPPKRDKRPARKRKILWFNPPFSMNVSTNIGAKFIKLIQTSFPTDHPLHKIFNKNSVKISYRCTKSPPPCE